MVMGVACFQWYYNTRHTDPLSVKSLCFILIYRSERLIKASLVLGKLCEYYFAVSRQSLSCHFKESSLVLQHRVVS